MDLLKELNEAQGQAVTHGYGPLLVLAGAGSGKTRVITYRIAYLIQNLNVPPHAILGVTFTNKAASEMKERIARKLPDQGSSLWIATFHSISVRILRREAHHLGYDNNFVIYDTGDQRALIKAIMEKQNLDLKSFKPRAILAEISRAKGKLQDAVSYSRTQGDYFQEVALQVFLEYEKELKKANALDFDDLINKVVELFTHHPQILHRYRQRFAHILVDEYQDVNYAQYRWVRLLAGENGNLCVVGDPDQGIYGFRGADIQNILDFEREYPQARVIALETNYRSCACILKGAQALIEENTGRKEKTLRPDREEGELIRVHVLSDGREEALYVVEEMRQLRTRKYGWQDMAVLYRTNAQSRVLEEYFLKERIPYKVVGSVGFYERKEIKDILAYLKVLYNPRDVVSLERIINTPRRGIGRATWEKILLTAENLGLSPYEVQKDSLPLGERQKRAVGGFYALMDTLQKEMPFLTVQELTERILEETSYLDSLKDDTRDQVQSRMENVQELFNVMSSVEGRGREALEDFLENVALINDQDYLDQEQGSVSLMTLHTAKGLEFPVVFMVGMEDGFCPHTRSLMPGEIEEERRLCYVGMTRAQDLLYMTRARSRNVFGNEQDRSPSPFLSSIPRDVLLEEDGEREREWAIGEETEPEEDNPYVVGRKIRHPKWGEGTIVGREGKGKDLKLTLAFPDLGIKDVLVDYVRLDCI